MFEGDDDDFSFIDEDFLSDALQHSESRQLGSKEHHLSSKQHITNADVSSESDISEKLPKADVKNLSHDSVRSDKCGLFGDDEKNHVNFQSRLRQSENKSEQGKRDDSGEFDDSFDNFEAEDNYDSLDIQSTPQDSEFTGVTLDEQRVKAHCEQKQNALASEDVHCERKTDFRSRILQTLKENRSSCISKNEGKHFDRPSGVSVNSYCLAKSERKRRTDLEEETVKKKIQIFSCEDVESELDIQSSSSLMLSPVTIKKSVSPAGPVIQKRKFPGPAGILPQLGTKTSLPSVQQLHEDKQNPSDSKAVVCSQSSADDFERGPWQQMVNDLEEDPLFHTSPLNVFNIKWVLRRADLRGQAGVRKIPFLAVMVRNIDTSFLDATVLLKDHTGEMSGTISSIVFEEYSHSLHPGCVLLLKDVTLLSPVSLKAPVGGREPTRRHYLNVTLNTILTIYSCDESGHVLTTVVCEVNKKEMFNRVAAMKRAIAPRAIVEEEEEEEEKVQNENKPTLFSNVPKSYGIPFIHQNRNASNTNSRIHGGTGNSISHPCTSTQQPQSRFCLPANNTSRVGGPSLTFSPRAGASNINGTIRPHRHSSPYQRPPIAKSASQGSFRPVMQQSSGTFSTFSGKDTSKSQTLQGNTVFCSQQEEKEVSDLLESVDADSLFGDF